MSRISATAAIAALVACSDTPATAVVAVFESDAATRAAIDHVVITAERSGEQRFEGEYLVKSDRVLPSTLTFSNGDHDPSTPMRLMIAGYSGAEEKISRRATLGFSKEKTKLLRMPLRQDCLGVKCDDPGTTCDHGHCVSDTVDANTLPDFESNEAALAGADFGGASGAGGAAGASGAGGSAGTAGTGGAAGNAGSAGSGGTGVNCGNNQPPTVSIDPVPPPTAPGVYTLSAHPADVDEPASGLTVAWTSTSTSPVVTAANQATTSATYTNECGTATYTVTVTDACGATAQASVDVYLGSGGYVSNADCNPDAALRCGSITSPWCDIQEAIDKTSGGPSISVKATPTPYGPFVINRSNISVNGAFTDGFAPAAPGVRAIVSKTFTDSDTAPVVTVSPMVNADLTSLEITGQSGATAAFFTYMIDVDGGTAGLFSDLVVHFVENGQLPSSWTGLRIAGAGAGSLKVADSSITLGDSSVGSTAVGIDASTTGDVTLQAIQITDSLTSATYATGVAHRGAGKLTISDNAQGAQSNISLSGGSSSSSFAVSASDSGPIGIVNSTLIGATNSGTTTTQQMGIFLSSTTPSLLTVQNCTIEGGRGQSGAWGIFSTGVPVNITGSTVVGTTNTTMTQSTGILLEHGQGAAASSEISNNTLIAGGPLVYNGAFNATARGLVLDDDGTVNVSGNTMIVACPPPGCGGNVYSTGLAIARGTAHVVGNGDILGGTVNGTNIGSAMTGISISTNVNAPTVTISGTTGVIRGVEPGSTVPQAAGIEIQGGSVTVTGNHHIEGGRTTTSAVGIFAGASTDSLTVDDNAGIYGGTCSGTTNTLFGIEVYGPNTPTVIRRNFINNCSALGSGDTVAAQCQSTDNTAAVYLLTGNAMLFRNMIFGNGGGTGSGLIWAPSDSANPTVLQLGYNTIAAQYGLGIASTAVKLVSWPISTVALTGNILTGGTTGNAVFALRIDGTNASVLPSLDANVFLADPSIASASHAYISSTGLASAPNVKDLPGLANQFPTGVANKIATLAFAAPALGAATAAGYHLACGQANQNPAYTGVPVSTVGPDIDGEVTVDGFQDAGADECTP